MLILLTLVLQVTADFNSIQNVIRDTCNELAKTESLDDMIFQEGGICHRSLLRFGNNYNVGLLEYYNEYGCWCYFYDNYQRGHGAPKTEMDTACKVLQDGYKCIEMDAEASGIPCPHQQTSYQTGGHFLMGGNCDETVYGSCQWQVCQVEMMFIQTVFQISKYSVDQEQYPFYKHSTGSWDKSECNRSGSADFELQCCGIYPFRWPYNILYNECCETDDIDP